MAMPLITIGIPTYNRARSLWRAIESALAQDYFSVEVVVSDNGSGDETENVCRLYSRNDARLRYIRHDVNHGPTANFRTVLEAAQGTFFMWLADDDWMDADYVRRCIDELMADPGLSLVAGRARLYAGSGLITDRVPLQMLDATPARRVLNYFSQVTENSVFYGVMRREFALRIPFHNAIANDWLFVAGLAFQGTVRTITQTTIHRAAGGTSSSTAQIAHTLGLPPFHGAYPVLCLAYSAFLDVVWEAQCYRTTVFWYRWLLAVRIFLAILYHKAWRKRLRKCIHAVGGGVFGSRRYEAIRGRIRAAKLRNR